ncbi:MAG: Cof-type HAD-IIB family hydrolase [Faecalibacterium sp.]
MDYHNIALFTDLDGTLFASDRSISAENRAAIHQFVEEGGSFGISTGRAPDNAISLLSGVEINSWSVILNGAAAYHFSEGHSALQSDLPRREMETLLRWVVQELPEVNIQLCTDGPLLLLTRPEYFDHPFVSTHQPMTVANVEDALCYRWLKVLFCAPRPVLEKLYLHAQETGATAVMDPVYTNEVFLEFLPKGINKGSCLHELRSLPELKGKTFVALGDYTNDLELLQEADVAVAVENALPTVKQIADHIVAFNDNHALADLIFRVLPTL